MTPKSNPTTPAAETSRPAHAWHLVLGLALWFAWFCATYGGLAVACAVAPPPVTLGVINWLNAGVLGLAAVTTAGFAAGAWGCARAASRLPAGQASARRHFVACVSAALYVIAAVSTVAVALPAVLLAPCA